MNKLRRLYLFFILAVLFSTFSYTENLEQNKKDVYIFIDISNSMKPVFNDVQEYLIEDILPEIEYGQKLVIFKFYRKMVPIFDMIVKDEKDLNYAKSQVGLLLANGPWTNIDNIFNYIKENKLDSNNAIIFLCTDGHVQLENNSSDYFLNNENIQSYLENVELIKKNGWFLCKFKKIKIENTKIEKQVVVTTPEKPANTVLEKPQEQFQFKFNKKMALYFLILLFILIILSIISYKIFLKQEKKSVRLKQLVIINKKSHKYIMQSIFTYCLVLVSLVLLFLLKSDILCSILFVFISIAGLYIILKTCIVIYKTILKSIEIQKIYNNLLEEAKKYDQYSNKEINDLNLEKEKNLHKQLVMGIICLKEKEFHKITKLDNNDMKFVYFAVVLQWCRQYLIKQFISPIDDKTASKNVQKGNMEKAKKQGETLEMNTDNINRDNIKAQTEIHDAKAQHVKRNSEEYNPTLEEIMNNPVPFDTTFGAPEVKSDIARHGGHRFTTLGHDPILGWIIGTANIATSTLTDYKWESYHVKTGLNSMNRERDKLTSTAKTSEILKQIYEKSVNQGEEGKLKVLASLVKEGIHLQSDINTVQSLPVPLPVIRMITPPELLAKLSKYNINARTAIPVFKHGGIAFIINKLISGIHWLTYDQSIEESLFAVKNKKIIDMSTLIAEGSNIFIVAATSCIADKKAIKKLDVGGIAIGIFTLFKNKSFIRQIKIEYIFNQNNKNKLI